MRVFRRGLSGRYRSSIAARWRPWAKVLSHIGSTRGGYLYNFNFEWLYWRLNSTEGLCFSYLSRKQSAH